MTITDLKQLDGVELVEASAGGANVMHVKCVRYTPGARSGKFHHYEHHYMTLELFKLWDVDKSNPAPKSPLT